MAPSPVALGSLHPTGQLDLTPQQPVAVAAAATAVSAGVSAFGLLMGAMSTIGNSMIDLMKKKCVVRVTLFARPSTSIQQQLLYRVVLGQDPRQWGQQNAHADTD